MKHAARAIFTFLFLELLSACAFAQDPIPLDTSNRCVLSGSFFGEELYSFRADPGVEAMIQRIMDASDRSRNFKVVNTNVVSVAAIVDGAERYLLYNSEFFAEHQRDTALRFALLAHEIGHLVNNHTLSAKKRLREESDADRFVGQVMRDLDFSLNEALDIANLAGYGYGLKPDERKKIIRRSWEIEDAKLRSGENAGYLNEERIKNLPMPRFPWPPPQCAKRSVVDNALFAQCKTLGDVNERLCKALDDSKYGQRSYFQVPNGFALVTQFEQYKADGTLMPEADRWKDYPIPNDTDWGDTFRRFFSGFTGHFRVFVFIVTDQPFSMDTNRVVSEKEGKAWLQSGYGSLPQEIAAQVYAVRHRATVLVYEFESKSSTNTVKTPCPGRLEPSQHLDKSGIKKFIKKC